MQSRKEQQEEYSFYSLFYPLTNKKAVSLFIIAGIIIFFNSLFNPFQGDDVGQIVNNPQITKLSNIPTFFFQSLVYSGINSIKFLHIYYKPILFTTFTIVNSLFGPTPFPFHLLQLGFHIANAILLFFLFSRFFNRGVNFFLTFIYLVHPINSEAVIYIADMQEVLYMFFGLLALLIVIKGKDSLQSYTHLLPIGLLLLGSLLSKETGILFSLIVLVYGYMFARLNFKRTSITVIATFIIYLFLRYMASLNSSLTVTSLSPIQQVSNSVKLLTIPRMFFYYINKFVLPIHLAIGQDWVVKQADATNFYIPLIVDFIFLLCVVLAGIYLHKKNTSFFKPFTFFVVWFTLGMIINLQIVPLDVTVADRWFYFPIIGLLGIIGLLITTFYKKIEHNYSMKMIYFMIAAFILIALSILTLIRNSEWQSRFQLLSHDVQYAQSPLLDSYYGGMLILNGQLDEARPYLEESVSLDPQLGHNLNNLAIYYEKKDNDTEAKKLYWENIHQNNNISNAYINISYEELAHIALNEKNPRDAKNLAEEAMKQPSFDSHAVEYLAIAESQLGEKQKALQTIQRLYRYSPTLEEEQLYYLIKSDKHFNLNTQSGSTLIY